MVKKFLPSLFRFLICCCDRVSIHDSALFTLCILYTIYTVLIFSLLSTTVERGSIRETDQYLEKDGEVGEPGRRVRCMSV